MHHPTSSQPLPSIADRHVSLLENQETEFPNFSNSSSCLMAACRWQIFCLCYNQINFVCSPKWNTNTSCQCPCTTAYHQLIPQPPTAAQDWWSRVAAVAPLSLCLLIYQRRWQHTKLSLFGYHFHWRGHGLAEGTVTGSRAGLGCYLPQKRIGSSSTCGPL